jgi:hypothetical protein
VERIGMRFSVRLLRKYFRQIPNFTANGLLDVSQLR